MTLAPHATAMPTATEILAALRRGETDPRAVIEAHLEVIAEHEPTVQAWCHLDADSVLDPSGEPGPQAPPGAPLAGVPVGLKDNIDTADMPTAYGTDIYAGHRPGRDAACAAALRLAGATILGKTVSTEFAHRAPGATRNPWDPEHTPGGSSSGSAAAVAAGMVPVALGTQTTGSVIRPAAYCGVLGYKPTYGEFNVAGVLPNTPSFDTLGVMARCVDDLAAVRQALLDPSIPDVPNVCLGGLRIGLCRTPWWAQASQENQAFIERCAGALRAAGCTVEDFDERGALDGLEHHNIAVSGYEFARTLAHERRTAMQRLSPVLRDGRMRDGLRGDYATYVASLEALATARRQMDLALADIDAVITPAAPGTAPEGLSATGPATFNMPWTTLHTPALTLPVGFGGNGLPLGLQVVTARHTDDRLLALGKAIFALMRPA